MGLIIGGVSARDLILDGKSVSLYVGGNPPVKVWPTTDVVQITLGTGNQARDQFRAALSARGLDHATITEVPFEIELVGTGSARNMFESCWALTSAPVMDTSGVTDMSGMFSYCQTMTHVPDLDTSQVTNMSSMFESCSALTHAPSLDTSNVTNMQQMFSGCGLLTYVPDMDTSKVTNMNYMFFVCASLTDGNVRMIGRNPEVNTDSMILYSGLTREPWYNADGTPFEVVQITPGAWYESQNQFRAALTARGLDHRTVTEVPFAIEFVSTGSAQRMFDFCTELTKAPVMYTSNVTDTQYMFSYCDKLTYIPDMDTSNVTDARNMFRNCSSMTDGSVRLIGRHPDVRTDNMIRNTGMTREPFYDSAGNPI